MLSFTSVLDVKVDDIVKKKKIITFSELKTAYNDVVFDWQFSFLPKDGETFPSIKIELIEVSEKFSKRFIKPIVSITLVTTITNDDNELVSKKAKFSKFPDPDNDIFYVTHFRLLDYSFDGEVPKFVKIYQPGNVFKIVVKLSIEKRYFDRVDKEYVDRNYLTESAASKLFNKLTDALENNFLSDVTLISHDHAEFKCHRLVLCANSTIFKTMFSNKNFEESNVLPWCKVKIDDIDGKTLKEMLRFIYTKEVAAAEFDDLVERVLYGSEKYDLQELKLLCEHNLKFDLDADNIFRYFEIAEKYKLVSLMGDCCKLFEVYFHLLDGESVENFYAQFPHLVRENF